MYERPKHGSVNRFVRGVYPHCRCGYKPNDNQLLVEHFARHGFVEVDCDGALIQRPIGG